MDLPEFIELAKVLSPYSGIVGAIIGTYLGYLLAIELEKKKKVVYFFIHHNN